MKFLLPLCFTVALLSPLAGRADEASHRKAVEQIFTTMDMEKLSTSSIDQMLDMQVKQNPAIAPYKQVMKDFLSKYMSWASMKEDMVKLYMDEFTEPELAELNRFYSTPVGRKTIQRMPVLMSKGAEMGQKRVQEHTAELQEAIAASMKK